jgi:hypothetical protein
VPRASPDPLHEPRPDTKAINSRPRTYIWRNPRGKKCKLTALGKGECGVAGVQHCADGLAVQINRSAVSYQEKIISMCCGVGVHRPFVVRMSAIPPLTSPQAS